MTKQTLTYIKGQFETGDIPTQQDFVDLVDTLSNEPTSSAFASVTQGKTVYVEHSADDSDKRGIQVLRFIPGAGSTNTNLDFDLSDESEFIQEDAPTGTDFKDGYVSLHSDTVVPLIGTVNPTNILNPDMLANVSGGFTAFASSIDGNAWKAFDRNMSYRWASQSPAVYPEHLGLQCSAPLLVNCIGLWAIGINAGYFPKTFTFDGSHNGSDWEVLGSWDNVVTTGTMELIFPFPNAVEYLYYRLTVYDTYTADVYVGVYGLNFYQSSDVYRNHTVGKSWVTTSDINHINLSAVGVINTCDIDSYVPTGTSIKGLVSFDGRVTWREWSGMSWVAIDGVTLDDKFDNSNNTLTDIIDGLTAFTIENGEAYLDFAFCLETTNPDLTPQIDQISLSFLENGAYSLMTPGIDFSSMNASYTTTSITKLSVDTENIKVNIRL